MTNEFDATVITQRQWENGGYLFGYNGELITPLESVKIPPQETAKVFQSSGKVTYFIVSALLTILAISTSVVRWAHAHWSRVAVCASATIETRGVSTVGI